MLVCLSDMVVEKGPAREVSGKCRPAHGHGDGLWDSQLLFRLRTDEIDVFSTSSV